MQMFIIRYVPIMDVLGHLDVATIETGVIRSKLIIS